VREAARQRERPRVLELVLVQRERREHGVRQQQPAQHRRGRRRQSAGRARADPAEGRIEGSAERRAAVGRAEGSADDVRRPRGLCEGRVARAVQVERGESLGDDEEVA
jgi:hypothetical protein